MARGNLNIFFLEVDTKNDKEPGLVRALKSLEGCQTVVVGLAQQSCA